GTLLWLLRSATARGLCCRSGRTARDLPPGRQRGGASPSVTSPCRQARWSGLNAPQTLGERVHEAAWLRVVGTKFGVILPEQALLRSRTVRSGCQHRHRLFKGFVVFVSSQSLSCQSHENEMPRATVPRPSQRG